MIDGVGSELGSGTGLMAAPHRSFADLDRGSVPCGHGKER